MKLSTRTRYGMRALLELAAAWGTGPLSVAAIADRQELSNKYLEQLMARLRSAGLVRAVPGRGYELTRAPDTIPIQEAMAALEGPQPLVPCLKEARSCKEHEACLTRPIWQAMEKAVAERLSAMTLASALAGEIT